MANLIEMILDEKRTDEELFMAFAYCLDSREDLDDAEKDAIFAQFCDALHGRGEAQETEQ